RRRTVAERGSTPFIAAETIRRLTVQRTAAMMLSQRASRRARVATAVLGTAPAAGTDSYNTSREPTRTARPPSGRSQETVPPAKKKLPTTLKRMYRLVEIVKTRETSSIAI